VVHADAHDIPLECSAGRPAAERSRTRHHRREHIRGYPSKAERDKRLKARGEDPEFKEVVQKAEANPETKLIVKVHNIDMVPHGPYTTITLAK
jgi:hypothetical protein